MFAWYRCRRIFGRIQRREQSLRRLPQALQADAVSPERIEFGSREFLRGKGLGYRLAYRRRILPLLVRTGGQALRSFSALGRLPRTPETGASAGFIQELERFARGQGVDALGYTVVEPAQLFRGQAALYPQAIVLIREMDAAILSRAPSLDSLEMIHRTYLELGRATNRVAEFLRARGYGAQAGPALGGAAVYPLLAERAGLGVIGMHGLLITPQFGSRQRISAIYTSLRDLPSGGPTGDTGPADREWVRDFCRECRACANLCPGQAILPRPVKAEGGGLRHIDYRRCLPHFYALEGCSWCIRECPFNRVPYHDLRRDFLENRLRLYQEV